MRKIWSLYALGWLVTIAGYWLRRPTSSDNRRMPGVLEWGVQFYVTSRSLYRRSRRAFALLLGIWAISPSCFGFYTISSTISFFFSFFFFNQFRSIIFFLTIFPRVDFFKLKYAKLLPPVYFIKFFKSRETWI